MDHKTTNTMAEIRRLLRALKTACLLWGAVILLVLSLIIFLICLWW